MNNKVLIFIQENMFKTYKKNIQKIREICYNKEMHFLLPPEVR